MSRNGLGPFLSDADDPQPMGDELCSGEDWADTSVSVRGEVPVLACTEDLDSRNGRTDRVSELSLPMCNPQIQCGASNGTLLCADVAWLCLLSSANAGTVEDSAMSLGLGGQSLDHWRGVIWDPGIVGQQSIWICYDCLCLMALFQAMRLLVHDWAVWPV